MSIASSGAGNPADSQVQVLTKYGLAINFKAAKVLGLEFSLALLARADDMINRLSALLRLFTADLARFCEGASQSWCSPAGESPARVRPSEPPGSKCCVSRR